MDPPALQQVLACVFGNVAVRKGRDERLVENPRFLVAVGDEKVLGVDTVNAVAPELPSLLQQLVLVVVDGSSPESRRTPPLKETSRSAP